MALLPAQTLNLCGVLSESKQIIRAHSRHFLALSVLFLLPLSFSLIIYPTLTSNPLSPPHQPPHTSQLLSFLRHPNPTLTPPSLDTLIFHLLYSLFVYLFTLFSIATITHSTHHGFYGRPVKLLTAIRSLFYSFFPLLSTAIAAQILIGLTSLAIILFADFSLKFVETLGFEIHYGSKYFTGFSVAVLIVLCVVLVCFQVNWSLAMVIVVVESKWGFEPLRRSSYLIRGMKSVSLSLILLFGVLVGFWVFWLGESSNTVASFSLSEWKSWAFVLQIVTGSSLLTMVLLHGAAANTVLYMYCKALHGELAFEIAQEFAHEYVSLPFDEEKIPHIVYVA